VDEGGQSRTKIALGSRLSSTGAEFGIVEHVLVFRVDLFDGIVVTTKQGRGSWTETRSRHPPHLVRCALSDAEMASLPAPKGPRCSGLTRHDGVTHFSAWWARTFERGH